MVFLSPNHWSVTTLRFGVGKERFSNRLRACYVQDIGVRRARSKKKDTTAHTLPFSKKEDSNEKPKTMLYSPNSSMRTEADS
jgi:hypothetical protein